MGSGSWGREGAYRAVNAVKCGAGNNKVWGVSFNQLDYGYRNWAAAVAGNLIIVLDVLEDTQIAVLDIYRDDDKDEEFFCVCWASNEDGEPLVCAAGANGVIRVVNVLSGDVYKTLVGHGGSVNDLRVHPRNRFWLLSGAKDESVRMWNLKSGVMIAIFGGDEGHRGDVLSVDFHVKLPEHDPQTGEELPVRPIIVSCGMDKTVRIWQFPEHLLPRVHEAQDWHLSPSKFKTINVKYTVSKERTLHTEFVDCVRWVGNLVMSKAGNGDEETARQERSTLPPNKILLWDPLELEEADTLGSRPREDSESKNPFDSAEIKRKTNVISEYEIPRSHHWFNKFSTDFCQRLVACGNDYGEVFVYDIHAYPPCRVAKCYNQSREAQSQCRQVALSYDGSTILSCHDNGQIWRWDKNER
ncbi:hypothetical protein KFL_004000010 [Klebsormidium nitens]|uniref:Uncharacterized protein n=1 Tax=Klebsormidium nitens TaxID=105231 RepID=A0A1Y1IIU3_KLENI|nr:hypothetical protein KFL_004000010 [Klebsormidium nitens]|eukprot:GAQ88098.1 hypothetical protein KFL_004000010 [Klebsormidium nitens]